MMSTDVLILGGGLAGLSTAYHLQRLNPRASFLIVEKNSRAGGLAGSFRQDGFTFDHTGHLLHLHDTYGKRFIAGLLKGNLISHQRSSWIYSKGAYARYPFQANTHGMGRSAIEDCIVGFLKTVHHPKALARNANFQEWCLATFGEGISRHFMFPYNQKLWRVPLSQMTTEWQGRFIPKPQPEEVLYGALADQKKFFGYNAEFLYPARDGAQALPDALAARVSNLYLSCRAAWVDLQEKTAEIEGLGRVHYERLVNTMPLPDFLSLAGPLPASVRLAKQKLRWNTVYNLNLGVARPHVSEKHWIYFPDSRYPFYRVGFSSNFSPNVAPRGASALYVEVTRRPEERVDLARLENQILTGLKACGILKSSDKLLTRLWITIPCAYVIYDFNRTPAVETIFRFLHGRGVDSIGRYGGWKYSFMEEAILDGKRCAERLVRG